MSGQTSITGLLGDVPLRTHCDHHAQMQAMRLTAIEHDKETAGLRAEVSRLTTLLGAAAAAQPDGRLALDWDDIDCGMAAKLTVYGWRGELVVVQDHEYVPDDGNELDRHLALEASERAVVSVAEVERALGMDAPIPHKVGGNDGSATSGSVSPALPETGE